MEDRPADEHALDRLLEATLLLGRDMELDLASQGLTPSRAHLLWQVGSRGPCTQARLASALGVSARTVTGLVDGLVGTGHVTREPHPGDRRAVLVTSTAVGEQVHRRMARGKRGLAGRLFGTLDDDALAAWTTTTDGILDRLRPLVGEDRGP